MQGQTNNVGLNVHTVYNVPQSTQPLMFTLAELAAALQLIKDQNDIFNSHEDDGPEPIPSPSHGGCPACVFRAHRHTCYACGTNIAEIICTIHMTTELSPEELATSSRSDFEGVPGS
ncbi:hypothetical protein DFJ58DRAFT_731447 [Suillus subalutaceus]|uniref:uncharacterized protein n=1 Tax=Suillus subalutaceus TaxID=48586 RepID=UPI001B8802ED|nr:uncharacterized protein DFJ58DRAFT_731447 [Suillus subalutaceus]KAG1843772.1 hypothetical protein DFJ58DRAFT_731447 [Suillus subalutaceus]